MHGLTLRGAGVTLAADRWQPDRAEPFGTVLLLHGGGQTRHSWQRTGQRLAAHGWTALALDTRGHGDSDWAADGDYQVDSLVADLRAVIATLDSPPVLVGASLGGLTSLIAEGERPGTARGLVLVDVTPTLEPEGTKEITDFMLSGTDGFATLDDAARAVHDYNPNRDRPPNPAGLRKNLREINGRWFWHWDPRFISREESTWSDEAEIRDWSTRASLAASEITVPTFLVRGMQSRVVSEAGASELQRLIPAARRMDVSGTGHMVAGDDNDVFSAGLLDWLDRDIRLAS